MYGLLTVCSDGKKHRRAVRCGIKAICGVRFYEVCVDSSRSRFLLKKRLRRAARLMERAGVCTALFPRDFSEEKLFESCGVHGAKEQYLQRNMASEITRRAMGDRGLSPAESCVAFLGDNMSAELRKALMEIALHVRYTLLSAGGGGGEICSILRRDYGVSVLRNAGTEQLRRADVVLTFGSAAPCGKNGCLWLPFGTVERAEGYENGVQNVRYAAPPEVEAELQVDCCRNALLSLLLEMGAVHANELEVTEIVQNA